MSEEIREESTTHYNNAEEQDKDEVTTADNWDLDNNFGKVEPNPMTENGMLAFLPEILQEAAKKNIKFSIDSEGSCIIEGFYKNGNLKVVPNEDKKTLTAIDRRKRQTIINNLQDLIKINYDWWKASTTKRNYITPERPWLDFFIENNWVEKQIFFVPKQDNFEQE